MSPATNDDRGRLARRGARPLEARVGGWELGGVEWGVGSGGVWERGDRESVMAAATSVFLSPIPLSSTSFTLRFTYPGS